MKRPPYRITSPAGSSPICTYAAGSSTENGGNNMEKPTVTIDLDRYTDLIKKEAIYDSLMKDKGVNMYLYVKEELTEDMNNGK